MNSPSQSPLNDPIVDAAQQARIAEIQRRRGATGAPSRAAGSAPTKRRKVHAAQGSRIAAAGIGVAAMLGLVGVMGLANRTTSADATPDDTSAQDAGTSSGERPVLIVIHQVNADGSVTEITQPSGQAGDSRSTNSSGTSSTSATKKTSKTSTGATGATATATTAKKKKSTTTTTAKPVVKTVKTKTTTKKSKSSGSK